MKFPDTNAAFFLVFASGIDPWSLVSLRVEVYSLLPYDEINNLGAHVVPKKTSAAPDVVLR